MGKHYFGTNCLTITKLKTNMMYCSYEIILKIDANVSKREFENDLCQLCYNYDHEVSCRVDNT